MSKVALVTGASSGIGEATVLALREQGWTVYAAARRVDRMAGLAERGVHVIGMDVADDASMVAGVERIVAEQGRLDALVNNAGYGSYGAVEDVPMEEARRQVEVNLFGLARLTQLVLPHMRDRRWGRIVNVSSIGGKVYTPFGAWYHATKHAVEGFSDALRMEVAPHGIDVVVIEPGGIRTEWAGIAAEGLAKTSAHGAYAKQVEQVMPMMSGGLDARASDPSVVAKGILKAVTARRPRTRYAMGFGARPGLFARAVLTDRGFDRLTRVLIRLSRRLAPAAH